MSEHDTLSGGRFPATRISVILAAKSADSGERARALETLAEAYWKPVYKYVRLKWKRSPEDAQDLTQGFFGELLERGLLARYEAGKSHLRTYLRMCADSYVMNEAKASTRQKRGGGATHLALDFAGAEGELGKQCVDAASIPAPESLDEFFEKEWVRNLFGMAVGDLQKFCAEKNKQKAFSLFEEYDLDGTGNASYAQLGEKYGTTATDVTNQLSWARREFRRIALERLHALCGSDTEFEKEARALFGRSSP